MGNGRSEGIEQLQVGCKNPRLVPNQDGRCGDPKNSERLHPNTNGILDLNQDGRLHPKRSWRLDPSTNETFDQNRGDGEVLAVVNGDSSSGPHRGTVGTGYGSLGLSPFLSNDLTTQKTSML